MEHLPTRKAYYITFVKRSSYESFLQNSFPRKIPNLVFKIDFVDNERDFWSISLCGIDSTQKIGHIDIFQN